MEAGESPVAGLRRPFLECDRFSRAVLKDGSD